MNSLLHKWTHRVPVLRARSRAWSNTAPLWGGVLVLLVSADSGCTSLTYSQQAVVDFARYRTAYVTVRSAAPRLDTAYLAQELREYSGFEHVTTDPVAQADIDLELSIIIWLERYVDADGYETLTWHGEGRYAAFDVHTQRLMDTGVIEEEGSSAADAATDVIDVLAVRYHRPFRL